MKSDLPLFYYQPNYVDHLEKSLSLNGKIFKDIIILKDESFPLFNSVYQHMTFNPDWYERLCFFRYFAVYKYVKRNNIDKFLMCDTDAIFLKLLDFENILGNDECVALNPDDKSGPDDHDFNDIVTIQYSIWTQDGLGSFCNFLMETYKNNIKRLIPKWEWHIRTQTEGGISDMYLMYLWYKGDKNLCNLKEGVFDININTSHNNITNEFKMHHLYAETKNIYNDIDIRTSQNYTKNSDKIKQLKKIDNKVFGVNYKNEMVEFYGLHFQGQAKKYMYLL
jgi:hypothetical protein